MERFPHKERVIGSNPIGSTMKVHAKYKKVTIYPTGDFWIIHLYRHKTLNPVQFGVPHKKIQKDYMRSLLEHYGFELVEFKDLPE